MRPTASAVLSKESLLGLLITNPVNIRYCTGCVLSSGMLLATKRGFRLFVDGRYTEEASQAAYTSVKVHSLDEFSPFFLSQKKWGIEADTMTLSSLRRLQAKFKNIKFVQTFGLIEGFRRKKYQDEISALQGARMRTKILLRAVPSLLVPGISEQGLAWLLRMRAFEAGGDDFSFDPIVAFGDHSSRPHHHVTGRRLKKGDIVQIDIGVKYHGYCGDLSEVYFTSRPTADQERIYGALKQAQKSAMKLLKPGADNQKPDEAARAVLKREGIEDAFTHALGHGVGLDIHEGITLSSKAPLMTLLKNEVVTVEPGVYFPGKFGMRVEEMVFVK